MKKHKIQLTTGEEYPVEINLGAMLLFKRETGREATEADMSSLSDLTILLWAGAASASEVAGVKFDYTPQQFANRLTPATLSDWTASLAEDQKTVPEVTDEGEENKKNRNLRAVRVCSRRDGDDPGRLLPDEPGRILSYE